MRSESMLRDFLICSVFIILYIGGTWTVTAMYQNHKISWILRDLLIFVLAFCLFGFGFKIVRSWMNIARCSLYGLLWGGIHVYALHSDSPRIKKIKKGFQDFSDSLFPKGFGKKK